MEIRLVGDPAADEVQARIRSALEAALGDTFRGAFIELRHRDGAFGVLAYSEAPVSKHYPSSGSRPRPAIGLGDRVEDVLRGLGLELL